MKKTIIESIKQVVAVTVVAIIVFGIPADTVLIQKAILATGIITGINYFVFKKMRI